MAKRWGEANDKTWEILLNESDTNKSRDFNISEVENLNCQTLRTLDEKWRNASRGEYGFGVQKGIYTEYYDDLSNSLKPSLERYTEFATRLGWFNNIQEIPNLSINTLYGKTKPKSGFYPIWFVYNEQLGTQPFGLPSANLDDYYYRDPSTNWSSIGHYFGEKLKFCLTY